MLRVSLRALLVVAAAALAAGAVPPSAPPPLLAGPSGDVGARVRSIVEARRHKSLRFSLEVRDGLTGALLAESSATTARRPASVAKVATTAAAMLALGPEHRLETVVVATAPPDGEGVVEGSLVVRGGGDPGFGSHLDPRGAEAALRDFARQVRASGVRRVTGDLVLDATGFRGDDRHPSWGWSDGEWGWDRAPVSALVLNDACVTVTVKPGAAVGAPGVVSVAPATGAVSFLNRAVTVAARKEHGLVFGRTGRDGRIPVTGGVLAKTTGWSGELACVDPVGFFGDVFRRLLREEGVAVAGRKVPVRSPGGPRDGPRVSANVGDDERVVARHGTPVARIAAVANTRSQNLYAELLLREMGRVRAGDGSFAGGAAAVTAALGFSADDPQFHLADGCGYSRENKMSAAAVLRILSRVSASPHRGTFMRTLARPGDPDGTLRRRFRGEKFKDRVLAKTGTLRDTKSLAGWVHGRSGRQYVFAILCEGDNGRAIALQDAVVEALVDG